LSHGYEGPGLVFKVMCRRIRLVITLVITHYHMTKKGLDSENWFDFTTVSPKRLSASGDFSGREVHWRHGGKPL
jgi:hypothetical protein